MSVKRFRKKPVVIEAVQYTGMNVDELREFVGEALANKFGELFISTLEGDMLISVESWVIKGVQGEFYPCKPDIFDATYEEVPE